MQIHDRKDQLIFTLTSISATLWVGLLSVGFWSYPNRLVLMSFWGVMFLNTVATCLMFLSSIACYRYSLNLEKSDLFKDEEKKKTADNKAEFWKRIWNKYQLFFYISIGSGIVAFVIRLISHLQEVGFD